jgi:hypothetical protein
MLLPNGKLSTTRRLKGSSSVSFMGCLEQHKQPAFIPSHHLPAKAKKREPPETELMYVHGFSPIPGLAGFHRDTYRVTEGVEKKRAVHSDHS